MRATQNDPRWSEQDFTIAKALAAAHIGKAYVKNRLDDYGKDAAPLLAHLEDPAALANRVMLGRCVVIQTELPNRDPHDLFMTYMRAWVLLGYNVCVGSAEDYFHDDNETGKRYGLLDASRDVAGLSHFFAPEPAANPLSAVEQRRLELRMRNRMDDHMPLVLCGVGRFDASQWWTGPFKAAVLKNADVVTLGAGT